MTFKVVLTDHVYPDLELEKELLAENDAELVYIDTKDETLIAEAVKDADAVVTCYAQINAAAIAGMTKCRSISKTGIGVNNIDVEAATKRGIRVMNVPDYCIEEVSDTAVALTLSLTRMTPFLWNNVRSGKWSLSGCEGISRLRGKVVGFLGFGRIARMAADKLRAFGVKFMAYDPYLSAEAIQASGAQKGELEEVIGASDILSLNLPLTDETHGIINKKTLSMMKPGAFLINTARGPLVNERDLCEAVQNGTIAGAGLDVICDEKYDPQNPLFTLPNVIVTPHSAFYSVESTQELREKILADVLAVLSDKAPRYQINKINGRV